MEHVKLIDRDHDEYLREVFDQDLPEDISIDSKKARVEKLQKDLEKHRDYRERKESKIKEQASVYVKCYASVKNRSRC